MIVKKIIKNDDGYQLINKLYSNVVKIEHFKEFMRVYYLIKPKINATQTTDLKEVEVVIYLDDCYKLEVLP